MIRLPASAYLPRSYCNSIQPSNSSRLVQDLLDLAPTADELLAAAHWTCTQDPSEGFLMLLRHMLTELGHGNLSDQL